MTELYIIGASLLALLLGYLLAKKIADANFNIYLEQAKARAKAIEYEAELVLKDAKSKVSSASFEAKKKYEIKAQNLKKQMDEKAKALEAKESQIDKKIQTLEESQRICTKEKDEANTIYEQSLNAKKVYEEKSQELVRLLEHQAGLTESEATQIILNNTEEKCRARAAHIVRKYEEDAKMQAKKRANYIIAQATTRFAGEYVAERLINVINLKNDDLKGRVIGKEGRNVKALELTLGVDIIIDETPNTIAISCFNLYRRAIATKTLELLIEDGRIQPARIEELFEKVSKDFEDNILEEGRNVVMDLGLKPMPDALNSLVGKLRYRASYGQNALAHSIEVAYLAGVIAAECGGDVKLARRAGLLHDIGKALTHDHEGSHVDLGGELCKRLGEHAVVINAIYAHHGHEEAASIEAAAVCTADTLSAARPGARREVLELYLKRVSELESLAKQRRGVKSAYAVHAGRELRVIVNAKLINDDEAALLAREIASDIEAKVQYPGEIKVNVIRELREVQIAR